MPRAIIIVLAIVLTWPCLSCRRTPYSLDLRIVVKGHVVDTAGRPVSRARVQARLGLDLDGTAVETAADGGFVADASSDFGTRAVRASMPRPKVTLKNMFILIGGSAANVISRKR
jgi:hypothetical protein